MNKVTNPAKRLLMLIEPLSTRSNQQSASHVWSEAFGLDKSKTSSDPHEIFLKLNLLREELDLVENLMSETDLSPSLYAPYLARIRNVISIRNLDAHWGSYQGHLGVDTILALKYCVEILPSESELAKEELQAVLDKVYELKQEIANSKLSRGVHDFLISQLSIIEKAVLEYPIIGSAAIKRAFRDGFSDLVSHADNLDKEKDKEEAAKVANIWSSLKAAGKEFVETDRIATAYLSIIEKGHSASQAVISLLT